MESEGWLEGFLDESIPLWREDPVLFIREVLLFEPDAWQIDVAYDLRDYPRVSVKSGQGVGKTGEEVAELQFIIDTPSIDMPQSYRRGAIKFADYKGVKVGIFVDADGSPTTIFPHNMEQPKKDGTIEGARD